MNFYKPFMHIPIQEINQWSINNLTQVMINLYHPWDPSSIKNELEVKVIFPKDDGFYGNRYD